MNKPIVAMPPVTELLGYGRQLPTDRLRHRSELTDYLVMWLDLVGHREKLAPYGARLLYDIKGDPKAMVSLQLAVASVCALRDHICGLVNEFRGPWRIDAAAMAELNTLSSEEAKIAIASMEATEVSVVFHPISDGFLVASPLWDRNRLLNFRVISHMVAWASTSLLLTIAAGMPAQAGISIGPGARLADGDLYGPVLSQAYECEREAKRPRVVVDGALLSLLDKYDSSLANENEHHHLRDGVRMCRNLLFQDSDHRWCVDYAGIGRELPETQALVKDALKHAKSEVSRCRAKAISTERRDGRLSFSI